MMQPPPKQLTQAMVDVWVKTTRGIFSFGQICYELNVESREAKASMRTILNRLEDTGKIKRMPGQGLYRRINEELIPIDWQNAQVNLLALKFPFGLEEFVKIYPKSIIILAGTKNVGKTAWLYNFVALNMQRFKGSLDLYNSETSPQQMLERFAPLNIPKPAPFTVYERYDDFADVIHPAHISVIDYLDPNSEVYLVGTEIDAIFRKLTSGVAVIGLQKPPPTVVWVKGQRTTFERDLAYGGGFTAKRACLYISLGKTLKLVYVKTPKQPHTNYANMQWTYNIAEDGIHFENIQRYYGEEEEQKREEE